MLTWIKLQIRELLYSIWGHDPARFERMKSCEMDHLYNIWSINRQHVNLVYLEEIHIQYGRMYLDVIDPKLLQYMLTIRHEQTLQTQSSITAKRRPPNHITWSSVEKNKMLNQTSVEQHEVSPNSWSIIIWTIIRKLVENWIILWCLMLKTHGFYQHKSGLLHHRCQCDVHPLMP